MLALNKDGKTFSYSFIHCTVLSMTVYSNTPSLVLWSCTLNLNSSATCYKSHQMGLQNAKKDGDKRKKQSKKMSTASPKKTPKKVSKAKRLSEIKRWKKTKNKTQNNHLAAATVLLGKSICGCGCKCIWVHVCVGAGKCMWMWMCM